jgi:hypothetical protein
VDIVAVLYNFAWRPLNFFYYFNLNALARLIFRTRRKIAVDRKTIVLYKRLILAGDNNQWIIAKN